MKLFILLISYLLLSAFNCNSQRSNERPLIIAHRGSSGTTPENTLAAFNQAIMDSADVIETDVHLSADGELVLIHDQTLDRTTNLKGLVKNYTLNQLKKADAGSWMETEWKGETIPTLKELITLANGKVSLLIEIKQGGDYYPGIEQRVVQLIQQLGAEKWCMFQSFSNESVKRLIETGTSAPIFKLIVGKFGRIYFDKRLHFGKIPKLEKLAGVNPNYAFCNKQFIRREKASNRKVYSWTVNKNKSIIKLDKKGISGIITNYPLKAKKTLNFTH